MIRIMCDVPGTVCKQYESAHNRKFKTLKEFEQFLYRPSPIGGVHDYIVYSGAVKRRYTFTEERKWERVLHPRGTTRKVKSTSAEVNVISSTPVDKENKVDSIHRWTEVSDSWITGAWSYPNLLEAVGTSNVIFTPYRVTFTDGSVTYFTRDGKGKPLYETSEDPTVKKMEVTVSPIPVSVPWHVAVEDIVLNNAEYEVHYNEPEEKTTFVVSYNSDYDSKLEMDHSDICFSIEPQVFNAKWYKKETK